MNLKKKIGTLGAAGAMTLAGLGVAAPAQAQPVVTGGLVNVTLVDLVDVNNNQIIAQVPISVAAAVCDVDVAVLAAVRDTGDTFCESTSGAVAAASQRRGGRPQ